MRFLAGRVPDPEQERRTPNSGAGLDFARRESGPGGPTRGDQGRAVLEPLAQYRDTPVPGRCRQRGDRLPIFALILLGAWDRRRDPRALVLLAGPLLYFAALHMVFVGSIRYRIPAEVPAMGLAAIGAVQWAGRRSARSARQAGSGRGRAAEASREAPALGP